MLQVKTNIVIAKIRPAFLLLFSFGKSGLMDLSYRLIHNSHIVSPTVRAMVSLGAFTTRLEDRIASSCAVRGFCVRRLRANRSNKPLFSRQMISPTVRMFLSTAFQFVLYCFATSGYIHFVTRESRAGCFIHSYTTSPLSPVAGGKLSSTL